VQAGGHLTKRGLRTNWSGGQLSVVL